MSKLVIYVVIILIIYVLFSTSIVNNRLTCEFGHVSYKEMLTWDLPGMYKMFNPSIVKYGDGYVLCTRYSNKTVKNLFMYMYSELNYKSYVCMALLTSEMKMKKLVFPVLNSIPLEDPRITRHNGFFYVSITEFRSKKEIMPTLYKLDGEFNLLGRIEYKLSEYFKYAKRSTVQKNWCPFSYEGKLLLHTDTYPEWRVFEIEDSGSMRLVANCSTKSMFNNTKLLIRCSTSWVSFLNGNLLCGLHTKQFCTILPTIRTILVEIDGNTLLPVLRTHIFCVDKNHTRIQFLSGMEEDGMHVYLTYGIGDYVSSVKRIPKVHIKNLLSIS